MSRVIKRLLIVDVLREDLELLAELLSEAGYSIKIIHEPTEIPRMVARLKPELILINSIPETQTYDKYYKTLKDAFKECNFIIGVESKRRHEISSVLGKMSDRDAVVAKPYDFDRLIEVMDMTLGSFVDSDHESFEQTMGFTIASLLKQKPRKKKSKNDDMDNFAGLGEFMTDGEISEVLNVEEIYKPQSEITEETSWTAANIEFGNYILVAKIEDKGMTESFLAKYKGAEGYEKIVILQRILPEFQWDNEVVEMFIKQNRIAASFNHQNLIQVYELGEHDSQVYITTEFIQGKSLRQLLQVYSMRNERLNPDLALYIISRLLLGLDYIHRQKDPDEPDKSLVHRALEPDNIYLTYSGEIKIGGFGITKGLIDISRSEAQSGIGKVLYMSPEQAWGYELDQRSDIFVAGLILSELLTSIPPYSSKKTVKVIQKARSGKFRPPVFFEPEIPVEINNLVETACRKQPDSRFQTAQEMYQAVQDVARKRGLHITSFDLGEIVRSQFKSKIKKEMDLLDTIHNQKDKAAVDQVFDSDIFRLSDGKLTDSFSVDGIDSYLNDLAYKIASGEDVSAIKEQLDIDSKEYEGASDQQPVESPIAEKQPPSNVAAQKQEDKPQKEYPQPQIDDLNRNNIQTNAEDTAPIDLISSTDTISREIKKTGQKPLSRLGIIGLALIIGLGVSGLVIAGLCLFKVIAEMNQSPPASSYSISHSKSAIETKKPIPGEYIKKPDQPPKVLKALHPTTNEWPAAETKNCGTVLLKLKVGPDGIPTEPKILYTDFDTQKINDLALRSIKFWRFAPATHDGVLVTSDVIVKVRIEKPQ